MVDDNDQDDDAPPGDDRKVKDLAAAAASGDELDPQTQADLARWFGLPSYQQLEDGEVKPAPGAEEDPDIVAVRETRARATAAVDPVFCESVYARYATVGDMVNFRPVELRRLDPSISAVDPTLLSRAQSEPREIQIPMGLINDLTECTPQAVLRDLHRLDLQFQLLLEVDARVESLRIDPVREARAAMASHPVSAIPTEPPLRQALVALEPLARAKREPWGEIQLPNRRVSE